MPAAVTEPAPADSGRGEPPAHHASIADLGKSLRLDVQDIPVGLIDPDEDNPNEVDDATMDALREEMRRGFLQPIVVRPEGARWRLIDGEHRWRLVTEMGYESIPAVVADEDADGGKVRLLAMNKLRGQLVPIRTAYMLADLAQRIPEAELRQRLGMSQAEFADTLKLTGTFTDAAAERVRESIEREQRDAPRTLTFVCTQRDAAAIEKALEAIKGADAKLDNGKALAKMARGYKAKGE